MDEEIVLAFIEAMRGGGAEEAFAGGLSYWFAHILNTRFVLSEIAYNPERERFAIRIGGDYYDITGRIDGRGWMDWEDYFAYDTEGAEDVAARFIDMEY